MLPPRLVLTASVEMVCSIDGDQPGIAIIIARVTTGICVVDQSPIKCTKSVYTHFVLV